MIEIHLCVWFSSSDWFSRPCWCPARTSDCETSVGGGVGSPGCVWSATGLQCRLQTDSPDARLAAGPSCHTRRWEQEPSVFSEGMAVKVEGASLHAEIPWVLISGVREHFQPWCRPHPGTRRASESAAESAGVCRMALPCCFKVPCYRHRSPFRYLMLNLSSLNAYLHSVFHSEGFFHTQMK